MYPWPSVDMEALRNHRFGTVADLMARLGVDHLVLTGADHIRYVSDFRALLANEPDWFVVVVGADGASDALVPYTDEVHERPDPGLRRLTSIGPLLSWSAALGSPATWVRHVAALIRRRGARRVGYDTLDARLLADLRAELTEVTFTSIGEELHLLRQVKHPLEVELIEAACRVNADAMEAALAVAAVGATDHDLLAAAMHHQQAAGVELVTHSVCNVRKGSGDWFASGARLRAGDAFFFDIGCHGVGGYGSDAARTGFVGEPHPIVLSAFRHLLTAHELAQSLVRPGVRASTVQTQVNDYLTGHGLGTTPYAVGHGVGLRICELPTIYHADLMDRDVTFENGHVIAVEPETSVEVDGQLVVMKVEDDFVIENGTLRTLTTPSSLDELIRDG